LAAGEAIGEEMEVKRKETGPRFLQRTAGKTGRQDIVKVGDILIASLGSNRDDAAALPSLFGLHPDGF
jgi:hypothetical protein